MNQRTQHRARRYIFSLLTMLLFVFTAQAFQQRNSLKISSLYSELISTQQSTLQYEGIQLINDVSNINDSEEDFIHKLSLKLGRQIPTDSSGIISNVKTLILYNVTGVDLSLEMLNLQVFEMEKSQIETLDLENLKIDTVRLIDNKLISLRISKSIIDEYYELTNEYLEYEVHNSIFTGYFEIRDSKVTRNFWIYDSEFHEGANIGPQFEGAFTDFNIEGCTFHPIDSNIPLEFKDAELDSAVYKTQVHLNLFGRLSQMYLVGNKFLNEGDEQFVFISGEFDYMGVDRNDLQSHLFLDVRVNKQLLFVDNEVTGKLVFASLILQGTNNIMHWRELGGFKMASTLIVSPSISSDEISNEIPAQQATQILRQTSDVALMIYNGLTAEELEQEDNFQGLISSYYRLYKVFKDNGQINDANQVYVEMKDVQLRKFKHLYKRYGGLENLIQWRLNGLLRFYTDYGTNPARAIRISIFVVLLFSIFYFFFPSEWDTKSKKLLIADYRTFVEKNQHGYFKPFLRLSGGFSKSLLNAMTLSLNAFVTLGFGTIPTSGLARYICILQGFMGWFLLSIFTASLINQVLF